MLPFSLKLKGYNVPYPDLFCWYSGVNEVNTEKGTYQLSIKMVALVRVELTGAFASGFTIRSRSLRVYITF